MSAQLVRMFLVDGDPEGITTLELSNSTVYCTVFPRAMFNKFKERKENNKPGVYILVGSDDTEENRKIYIGEGDPVGPRLYSHDAKKDFWEEAIVLTSKDDYLTKTQIQFLESKLIEEAKICGRVILENGNFPQLPSVSEVDEAEVAGFLSSCKLLIKSLRYNFFTPLSSKSAPPKPDEVMTKTPIFEIKHKAVNAQMQIIDGKYVILKGSQAILYDKGSISNGMKKRRQLLKDNALLLPIGDVLEVQENIPLNSPSTAADVIFAGSTNGWDYWTYQGMTLREYDDKQNST